MSKLNNANHQTLIDYSTELLPYNHIHCDISYFNQVSQEKVHIRYLLLLLCNYLPVTEAVPTPGNVIA